MAESSKSDIKESKEQSNGSADEELDALLDDALKDFANPEIATPSTSIKKKTKKNEACKSSASKKKGSEGIPNSSSPDFDSLFSEESFAKMAEEFSKAFESLPAEDLDVLKGLNGDALNAATSQGPFPKQSLDENLENAWSSLEKNIKDMKEERPEDVMDGDFLNAMRGLGIEGADGGPDGLMSMMQGMMTNLLSKDILYPSLKEIQSKYPSWLSENRSTLSQEDFERFERQQELVSRICVEFEGEADGDSDETKKRRLEKIMDLMQKMQACGQPPFELLDQNDEDQGLDSGQPKPNFPNPDQCVMM